MKPPIRPETMPAQVDSGAKIIRVRGVDVEGVIKNLRLKWNGGAYSETPDEIEFFPDTGDEPTELAEDAEAMCVWMPAAERWEVIGSGTGSGGGGGTLARFELMEDKPRTTVAVEARVIDEITGAPIGDGVGDWQAVEAVAVDTRRRATAAVGVFTVGDLMKSTVARTTTATFDATEAAFWTLIDETIRVVDPDLKHAGYVAYTDPEYGETVSYRGFAYKFTDNYSMTGFPGYVILDMEGQARFIDCTLLEDKAAAATTVKAKVDFFYGLPPNGRAPRTTSQSIPSSYPEGPTGTIGVVTLNDYLDQGFLPAGTTVRAELDERNDGYVMQTTPPFVLIRGKATSTVTPGGSFQINNVTAIIGRRPVNSTDDLVTVVNIPAARFAINDYVYALFDPTVGGADYRALWRVAIEFDLEAILHGFPGFTSGTKQRLIHDDVANDPVKWLDDSTGVDLVHFELNAPLILAATSVVATVISSTDGTVGLITVTDPEARFVGSTGYKGYAYSDGTVYHIISMEGPSRFADCTATARSVHTADTITATLDFLWGSPPNGKDPDVLTGVTVHKLPDHDITIEDGDRFRAIWDEDRGRWLLFWFDGLRLTVKGTIAGTLVSSSTSTFTLSSPTLANGWRLPGSITVTNDPPIYADVGAVVYARFNLTVGTGPTTNWDTGDGGNFLPKLRGIGSYNTGLNQVVLQAADNNPEWGEVSCGLTVAAGKLKIADIGGTDLTWNATTCKLDYTGVPGSYTGGCGINIAGTVINFDPNDVAGVGLHPGVGCSMDVSYGCGLTTSGDSIVIDGNIFGLGLSWSTSSCDVEVQPGPCGIKVTAAGVEVETSDLQGDGLEVDGCKLKVKPGPCGIKVSATGVEVENTDLAGDGLEPDGTCKLKVKDGCGIKVSAAGGVEVDNLDLAGSGLGQEGSCGLKVNQGCGILVSGDAVNVYAPELAGAYLYPGAGCALNVVNNVTPIITEITSLAIEGSNLVLRYKRAFARVIEIGSEIPDLAYVAVEEC